MVRQPFQAIQHSAAVPSLVSGAATASLPKQIRTNSFKAAAESCSTTDSASSTQLSRSSKDVNLFASEQQHSKACMSEGSSVQSHRTNSAGLALPATNHAPDGNLERRAPSHAERWATPVKSAQAVAEDLVLKEPPRNSLSAQCTASNDQASALHAQASHAHCTRADSSHAATSAALSDSGAATDTVEHASTAQAPLATAPQLQNRTPTALQPCAALSHSVPASEKRDSAASIPDAQQGAGNAIANAAKDVAVAAHAAPVTDAAAARASKPKAAHKGSKQARSKGPTAEVSFTIYCLPYCLAPLCIMH